MKFENVKNLIKTVKDAGYQEGKVAGYHEGYEAGYAAEYDAIINILNSLGIDLNEFMKTQFNLEK